MTTIPTYSFDLFGIMLTVNYVTIFNTWVIMATLIGVALIVRKKLQTTPGPAQRSLFPTRCHFVHLSPPLQLVGDHPGI